MTDNEFTEADLETLRNTGHGDVADHIANLQAENERLATENSILRAARSGAVWVCPECDIAGCKHYRAALKGETP